MIYIDFDDVILNTTEVLVNTYNLEHNTKVDYVTDENFMINYDYNKLLNDSDSINNSIEILKRLDQNKISILTKVLSLDNEGLAKINYLRNNGIECNVILVPEHAKKTDVVKVEGCILVDDLIKNLDDWSNKGGISIFFDRYGTNIDALGVKNTKYESTNSLEILNKY